MSEATIIGIELAKRVFQLHGARDDGSVVIRKSFRALSSWPSWRSTALMM